MMNAAQTVKCHRQIENDMLKLQRQTSKSASSIFRLQRFFDQRLKNKNKY